jgi:hypothetical protein
MANQVPTLYANRLCAFRVLLFVNPDILINITTISGILPSNLRCEYPGNSYGIDVVRPRLSWWITARACQDETAPDHQISGIALDSVILKELKNKQMIYNNCRSLIH